MSMEYRSWIEVPGLPYAEEAGHERLFEVLLRDNVDLGPVMSWSDDGNVTLIVLTTDSKSQAAAVAEMTKAVAQALVSSGLDHLQPVCAAVTKVNEATAA
jgi:hypothetical protein